MVPGSSFNVPYRNHFSRDHDCRGRDHARSIRRIVRVLARRADSVAKVVPIKARSAVVERCKEHSQRTLSLRGQANRIDPGSPHRYA